MEISPLHSLMVLDKSKIHEANCVLAKLWRIILYDLGLHATIWEGLLVRWSDECRRYMPAEEANNLKGNLSKALARDELAWIPFVRGMTVLNFRAVRMELSITDKGVSNKVAINIPPTYTDDVAGKLLKVLWQSLMNAYPERAENWGDYIGNYCQTCNKLYGDDASNLRGNLTRALGREALTWNTFYRGLAAMDLDEVTVAISVDKQGLVEDTQTFAITLRRSE